MNEREFLKKKARIAELAAQSAKKRATIARWDLNVVTFMFAILVLVLVLYFEGFGTAVVAPVAFFGLAMCWLVGWRRQKQLYERFYDEELSKYEEE